MTMTGPLTPTGYSGRPRVTALHTPRFGQHAPALPPQRASYVTALSRALDICAVAYVLWMNYVVFRGGDAPLTPWHLSQGNAGAGTFMLFLGNWLLLLVFHIAINGSITYVLTGLLQPRRRASIPRQYRPAAARSYPTVPNSPPVPVWVPQQTGRARAETVGDPYSRPPLWERR